MVSKQQAVFPQRELDREVKYSIVVPLKDEEKNVLPLIGELEIVMEQLGAPWELICVDDGSTDGTLHSLEEQARVKPYLRILSFDRNYGQSSALDAGFKKAQGAWMITLD